MMNSFSTSKSIGTSTIVCVAHFVMLEGLILIDLVQQPSKSVESTISKTGKVIWENS